MNKQWEFIDCPNCRKRILSTARLCHHCHTARSKSPPDKTSPRDPLGDDAEQDALTEHDSLEHGGYDDRDDFDYDAYLGEEFPDQPEARPKYQVPPWVWATAWLLIFSLLLPFLLQVLVAP